MFQTIIINSLKESQIQLKKFIVFSNCADITKHFSNPHKILKKLVLNVWQKPLQYCKVISLQLIKKEKEKEKKAGVALFWLTDVKRH